MPRPRIHTRILGQATSTWALAALLVSIPVRSSAATLRLLDDELRPPDLSALPAPSIWLATAAASDREGAQPSTPPQQGAPAQPSTGDSGKPSSLDFDLLGAPKQSAQIDQKALERRRTFLTWHQGVGLGMFALQLATTVVGQLNYDDKFGGANTGKYVQPHAILAGATLAAFAAAGTLALLAPKPIQRDSGFDRVSLHKLSMLVATAGMVAQGVLGVWTQSREGYLNQQSLGTAHLVIGYVTLAAVATGVGALVL